MYFIFGFGIGWVIFHQKKIGWVIFYELIQVRITLWARIRLAIFSNLKSDKSDKKFRAKIMGLLFFKMESIGKY